MSVINQMLRELDAREGASADSRVVSLQRTGARRKPGWLVAGGVGLAVAAGAAIYWMLPATPIATAPEASQTVARPEREALSPPPAAAAVPVWPASPPDAAARSGAPAQTPHTPERAGETADGATDKSLPAGPESLAAFRPRDPAAPHVEPAGIEKIPVPSPEAEAQQLYDDARVLVHSGKSDAALGRYRQALERNPALAGARIELARLLQEKGHADEALSVLQAGYAQRADEALAIAAGRLHADMGRPEAALAWLQRGLAAMRPADHALMGALLSQAQRHEEASRAYQRALAADPGQGGWLLGLGLALEAQGRSDEARDAYRSALERGQFKPEVMEFLRERSGLSGR